MPSSPTIVFVSQKRIFEKSTGRFLLIAPGRVVFAIFVEGSVIMSSCSEALSAIVVVVFITCGFFIGVFSVNLGFSKMILQRQGQYPYKYLNTRGEIMSFNNELRLPALEVKQGSGRLLYSFAVDGKLIPTFATVSRIHRSESNQIDGYQRPEVLSHIAEIRNYLESEAPMIPNAVVIAFDTSVRFEPSADSDTTASYTRVGTLVIPNDS